MVSNGRSAPEIRLGATTDDGIAASIFVLVERGAARRPALAMEMRGRIELRFEEALAPVRLVFEDGAVVVEDGAWEAPDLRVSGRLPHVVALTVAPLVGGVPNPATGRGAARSRRSRAARCAWRAIARSAAGSCACWRSTNARSPRPS